MAKTFVCRNHKKPLFAYVVENLNHEPTCAQCSTVMEATDERQATWL